MLASTLFAVFVLGAGIHAQDLVPRQSINVLTPVADPSPAPLASGKPTTPTITVTAVVTTTATETEMEVETTFVTVINTVINNVTIAITETETDSLTEFVTDFVTNVVTEIDVTTDLATEVLTQQVTQQVTLPAVTDVVTQKVTLPAVTDVITQKVTLPAVTDFITQKVTLPAVTIHTTATKTVTATSPLSTLCPNGNEEVFDAGKGVFIILCSQSRQTYDLIPGGQATDSVYTCAQLCDGLTSAGVACSAGMFESETSTCFPQGVDDGTTEITTATGFDTAVLNTTSVANSLNQVARKRSIRLF